MQENEQFLYEIKNLYKNGYVSYSELQDFKMKYEVPNSRQTFLIKLYLNKREKANKKFIKLAQRQNFEIEGCKLDKYQIAAVVANEDAELILAPAGSGKTATLLAKVEYLIRYNKIPAENILVIAFTNKVVEELKERLKNNKVEIRTFHSFGNKVIKNNLKNYRLLNEETTKKLIQKSLADQIDKNNEYAKKYRDFFENNGRKTNPEIMEELIESAIGLQKSERIDLEKLKTRIKKIKNVDEREEAKKLFELYAPVYQEYEKYLKDRNFYDFSDMLNLSTDFVEKMPDGSFKYEYILVDEAQDLSKSKCLLLKATLEKCKKAKLFAVGDDWQSIYRFAGSNLKVLNDFEKIFGRQTYRGAIELTYRFGQPTARISNRFIVKNRSQSRKHVRPAIRKYTPIEYEIFSLKKKHDWSAPYFLQENSIDKIPAPPDYNAVNKKLLELLSEYGTELRNKRIQIISRFNRDVFRIVKQTKNHENVKFDARNSTFIWKVGEELLTIPFCTIHKAKGITRDIVFVINMNEGSMPANRDGNPMLETMMTDLDNYPFAEERRLFYVAITRAKERTILVAEKEHMSEFLLEINPKIKKWYTG